MMHDDLDERLREALREYRVPPKVPLDEMWDVIEERHFGRPLASIGPSAARARAARRWHLGAPSWGVLAAAVAASLVIGVALGRTSNRMAPPIATYSPEGRYDYLSRNAEPYRETTTEYLGQTVALLTTLRSVTRDGQPDAQFVAQAADLLGTTRLLLDSPAAEANPRLKTLLEDLELVLAQLARLPASETGTELDLITEALEQRDVVPRLRSAVVSISSADN